MEIPRVDVAEEKLDHGEVFRGLAELADKIDQKKLPSHFAGYVSRHLLEIERAHAENLIHLQAGLCAHFERAVLRRYEAGSRVVRLLSLGRAARRDMERAVEEAFAETERLGTAVQQMSLEQVITAVKLRISLFQMVTGSREEAIRLAMRMLQGIAPRTYQRLMEMATGGEEA